ncbi:MAG: cytochrome c [Proteobacteria bacterium]|nr:cytochrome c [Pseudomonadota bacterium]
MHRYVRESEMTYLKRVRLTCCLVALALFLSILYSVGARAEGIVKISLGERVFTARCAVCHGERGIGTETGPPLVHKIYHPNHHGDFSFNLAVTRGVRAHHWKFGSMEKVEGVTRAEIEAIIEYVRALQREAGIY